MAANSAIQWCDDTFNPWEGCTRVGPGCDNCYAEARNLRLHGGRNWGPGAPRRRTSVLYWRAPQRWNKQAPRTGERRLVFGGSLCDPFDNEVPAAWRADYWALIRSTPWLTWILVTKRVGNVAKMLPEDWGPAGYANVWLLITVCTQGEADRDIGKLLDLPAARRGLSVEPLLEAVDLNNVKPRDRYEFDALLGYDFDQGLPIAPLDWVICGGESGRDARAFDIAWARDLRDQCAAAQVPFFMKQLGSRPYHDGRKYLCADSHGGAPEEWPEDLRVRQFPAPGLTGGGRDEKASVCEASDGGSKSG